MHFIGIGDQYRGRKHTSSCVFQSYHLMLLHSNFALCLKATENPFFSKSDFVIIFPCLIINLVKDRLRTCRLRVSHDRVNDLFSKPR